MLENAPHIPTQREKPEPTNDPETLALRDAIRRYKAAYARYRANLGLPPVTFSTDTSTAISAMDHAIKAFTHAENRRPH